MTPLVVVDRLQEWPYPMPGISVASARAYLTDPAYAELEPTQVLNLCAADRYQGRGYYVSLIAEARGHAPWPDVKTIEEIDSRSHELFGTADAAAWLLDADGAACIDVDAYFGCDPARRNEAACERLFTMLRAPLFRATFALRDGQWRLERVKLLAAGQLTPEQRAFAAQAATEELATTKPRSPRSAKPSLAILHDPGSPDAPSNAAALERFHEIALETGLRLEVIGRNDLDRLLEFDALFIRDTTNVNHYTYQFARQAAAAGLVVIDDPDSILKCTNKVYLCELLSHHRVPAPKTMIVHRDNIDDVIPTLGLPCIVKQPDSAFSRGVTKVETAEALVATLNAYLQTSELVVAQEWLPTSFDWRVGVLDGWPLFVCKYLMAPGHWQVVKREREKVLEGATIALPVGEAPTSVVRVAVQAARLIGDGLYGVDVKEVGDKPFVIEVNDNPNIDAGNEDGVLGDALYREVLGSFVRRIRERDRGSR